MRNITIFLALGLIASPTSAEVSQPRLLKKLKNIVVSATGQTVPQSKLPMNVMPLVPLTNRDLNQVSGAGCSMQVGSKTYLTTEYGGNAFVRYKGDTGPMFLRRDGDFDLDRSAKRTFTISAGTGVPPVVFEFMPLASRWKSTQEEQSSKPVRLTVTQLMKNGSPDYEGRPATLFTLQGIMSCGA